MGTATEGGVFSGADLLGTPMSIFLVQAILVILLTRLLAMMLHYIGQPRVIAEVLGGILLGPSVFGHVIPGFEDRVFPRSSLGPLGLVANIGLVLYLFLVGIEMDPKTMLNNAKKTSIVAVFGVGLPFALGFGLAAYLFDKLMATDPEFAGVNERSFAVFVCVAISITAFPVLARILNETGILTTVVGATALGAAALDDVTAWSLLALSIALIHAGNGGNMMVAAYIFLSVAAYAFGMLALVRPAWHRLIRFIEKSESRAFQTFLMALTFLITFFSAWATEVLGVHAIFGAFLFGLAMPRGHPFTLKISERIEDIVQIVFLPLYFTLSGLKTDVGTLEPQDVTILVVVVLTAIAAKFVGCSIGAKFTGLSWRESASVGVLMNTRGLVELIVLNIGLEAKVITDKLFTILVLMAIITTVMTTPIMHILYPPAVRRYVQNEAEISRAPMVKGADDVNVLMLVHHLEEIPALTAILHMLKPCRKGLLRITGAHLVESSIATTDILRARERARGSSSLTSDPSLQMLSMVGTMVGAKSVETDVLYGNPRSFAQELIRKGRARLVDVVIVPHRQGIYFMADSYEHFLKELLRKAEESIVILVNPAAASHNILPVSGERKEILVVVTGEENDHEVLNLARRFLFLADVMLTLVVVEDEATPFDDRVRWAVHRFKQGFLPPKAAVAAPLPAAGISTGSTPPRLDKSGSGGLPPSLSSSNSIAAAAAAAVTTDSPQQPQAPEAAAAAVGGGVSSTLEAAAGALASNSSASGGTASAQPAAAAALLDSSAAGAVNVGAAPPITRSTSGGGGVAGIIRQTSAAVLGVSSSAAAAAAAAGAVPGAPPLGPQAPPRLAEIVLREGEASKARLLQIAAGKPYDFILVGHATAPLAPGQQEAATSSSLGYRPGDGWGHPLTPKGSSRPTTPRFAAGANNSGSVGKEQGAHFSASALGGGGGSGVLGGSASNTPRYAKSMHTAVDEVGILGTVADALKDDPNVAASLLVVHSAHKFADSTLSVRAAVDPAAAAAVAAAKEQVAAASGKSPVHNPAGSVILNLGAGGPAAALSQARKTLTGAASAAAAAAAAATTSGAASSSSSNSTPATTAGASKRPALKSLEIYEDPAKERGGEWPDLEKGHGHSKSTDAATAVPPSGLHKD